MKNSGVEWIVHIPNDWIFKPLKFVMWASDERVKDHPDFELALSVSGYRGVEPRNVTTNDGQLVSEDNSNYRIVHKGQLVVNTMWLNFKGLGVSALDGYVSPAYQSYYLSNKIESRFAHYLLRSYEYVQKYTSLLYGVRPNSLQVKRHDFERLGVLLPSADQQKRIADFLDEKTAVIDEVEKKKKKQIELLKEKRAALITQAVTKGLDPNVKMKDSGVEWIGEMPEGWDVQRQKDFISTHFGGTWGDGEATEETGTLCVRVADFVYTNLRLKPEGYTFRDVARNHLSSKKLQLGDLLLEKSGGGEKTPVGRIVQFDLNNTAVNSNFIETIRLNDSVDSKYFTYLNRAMYVKGVNKKFIKQTTGIQNLDVKSYFTESIPVPSTSIQKNIAYFLDKKTLEIDRAIKKIQKSIRLIQEYRSSLISHAVTGKIVVE